MIILPPQSYLLHQEEAFLSTGLRSCPQFAVSLSTSKQNTKRIEQWKIKDL